MSAEGGRGDEGKGVEGGVFAGKGAYNECKRYQEAGEGKQHEDAEWERHPACPPLQFPPVMVGFQILTSPISGFDHFF